VLENFGYKSAEIERLIEQKAVIQAQRGV